VLGENYAAPDDPAPESASLYLLDPAAAQQPVSIASASGDSNSFKLAWSPSANELLYQRRLVTPAVSIGDSNNHPAGPLMLFDAGGNSRVLREIADEGWVPWVWLSANRVLVAPQGRFTVVGTDGSLIASHTTTGNGRVVPSPGGGRLAFLDRTDQADLSAYILAIDEGEYRVLGPASSIFLIHGNFDDSELRWSPDGSWLAWNRNVDVANQVGELYAHDLAASQTRELTGELAQYPSYSSNWFSWLPERDTLDYVAVAGNHFELLVTDLTSDKTQSVGELASTSCNVNRAWPTNEKVIVNLCGEGAFLARLKQDGSFTQSRLLNGDIWTLVLTEDREIAVMQTIPPTNDNSAGYWDANWMAYIFSEDRLQELDATGGSVCCGSLLQ
jgi:Tol biopolymer transport system component